MRALYFAVFLLAGCKTVHTLDAVSKTDAATAAEVSTHEIISTGPEHIVMTVEEYEQLCPGSPAGDSPRPLPVLGGGAARPVGQIDQDNKQHAQHDGNDPHAPSITLLRRTVTVTDRGPSLDDLRSLSSLRTQLNTALEVKEEKKSGPAGLLGLLGSLWPVVLIGGAVLAVLAVLKLKPPWLSFLFKLLGRTP